MKRIETLLGSVHYWLKGVFSATCQRWLDRDSILMKDTCLENSFICQPQQRNIHGRSFGGFFIRAFELPFSTAYAFAGVAPHFMEVDRVDFYIPVIILT